MKIARFRATTHAMLVPVRLCRFIAFSLTFWFSCAGAEATQSITLAWDPSPDPSATGYYVHYGTASQVYSGLVDAGSATLAKVNGLVEGQTYFFAVTAYNAQRVESVPSGEIAYTVPVPKPVVGQLRLLPRTGLHRSSRLQFLVPPARLYEVQASEDLHSWKTIYLGMGSSTNWVEWVDPEAAYLPKRFYRLVLPDHPQVPGTISILRGAVPPRAICLKPSVMPGERYEIQASEDLTTWTTLHEGIRASAPPMDFIDANAAVYPKRFYRLALPDNPQTPRALKIFPGGVSQGACLRVAVVEGHHYRIEASEDLATWTTIYEAVSRSPQPVDLVDPEAGSHPKRFYRLAFD